MIDSLGKWAGDTALTIVPLAILVAVGAIVERRHPIETDQSRSAIFLDYKIVLATLILKRVFAPVSGAIVAMGVNMAGGGLFALRDDGWWFPLSLAIVVLAVELQGYWFHRLQHCI